MLKLKTDIFPYKPKSKKGQIFSIDALLSFGIFLIILLIVFFVWNYSITKTTTITDKENVDIIAYVLSSSIVNYQLNNSISSFFAINDALCKKYGMYESTMHCFSFLTLENSSTFMTGNFLNGTGAYSSTEVRMVRIENQAAILTVGVSNE